jgi:hypothetical protein
VAGVLAAVALAGAAVVFAQALKIPDFRRSPPPVAPGPRLGEPCDNCGVIRSIREVESQRPIPVPKSVQSGPASGGLGSDVRIGAVIALPLGGGNPYVGGVGTPEMRERFTETTYEIIIRLDNGNFTTVQRSDGASFQVGDRVRVRGIQLELLAP